MSDLSQFVEVNITQNTATIEREGFGIPLWLGYHTVFPERVRTYRSLSAMISDGFTLRAPAYRAVARGFAQSPRPGSYVIGRLPAAHTHTQLLTITSAVAGQYIRCKVIDPTTGTVNQIQRLIPAASNTTAEATAVELLIEAVTGVSSSAASAVITITPATPGDVVYIYDLENCTLQDTTPDAGYDDELAALKLVDNTWFFITLDTASEANVDLVAAWAASNDKMLFVHTIDDTLLAGTGTLGSDLKTATNQNVVLLWAPNFHECGGDGYLAKGAPKTPGSISWAYKNITGLTPKTLTDTQANNLTVDNINWYQTKAGRAFAYPGVCAGGEKIKIVHGTYAWRAAVSEEVFGLLINNDEVPYDDVGRDMLIGAVSAVTERFEKSGLFMPGWTVTAPSVADQTDADKAAGRFPDINVIAEYKSSIIWVGVNATFSF